jgi:UDP-N-acetyl-D-mannosaminuronic acid transferase (WecB/TagA/CpsF family)
MLGFKRGGTIHGLGGFYYNSKEFSVLEQNTNEQELIELSSLAELTGFPLEMIKKELFNSSLESEKVTLADLRKAMVSYIDATMLEGADS